MRRIVLQPGADHAGFRRAVRLLVDAQVPPEQVIWNADGVNDLFGASPVGEGRPIGLPRGVATLVEQVVRHRDEERYALLYALIWRVVQGERNLMEVSSDPLVHRLERMRHAIARDLHKMHAFLRFRRVEAPDGQERFVAWFEPDHFIVEAAASFFVERFRSMIWSILTPVGSLDWDGERLIIGPPCPRQAPVAGDGFEAGWLAYYESTFNPARLNTKAMQAEMPKKYWRNMPETASISALVQSAPSRVRLMLDKEATMPRKSDPAKAVAAMADQAPATLDELNRVIASAEPLVPGATRAVLGEGPVGAPIAFVGEQPGDQEDVQGRPFVGPAGQMLDRAMKEAGIDRDQSYLTNAVKHFKFVRRGKRRIHEKPTTGEVKHYRWWLMKELDLVRPRLVVALGATAVLALAGKAVPVNRARGAAVFGDWSGYITVHPAYLLRLPDEAAKVTAYAEFVEDLTHIREMALRKAS